MCVQAHDRGSPRAAGQEGRPQGWQGAVTKNWEIFKHRNPNTVSQASQLGPPVSASLPVDAAALMLCLLPVHARIGTCLLSACSLPCLLQQGQRLLRALVLGGADTAEGLTLCRA